MDELTQNARRVLEARYLARDETGSLIEDWEGLCQRVAEAVAAPEVGFHEDPRPVAELFAQALQRREFLPNSPTLMNAGTALGQLAACFVLPVEDTLDSIFEAVKRMAVIHQSGGGTGFDFSRLRPSGDPVQRSHGVASGPVSFIHAFDATTSVIKQGGRRRGANMGVLRVDHPDVLSFVRAKHDPERLSNFNLSITTPDAFWKAVESEASFDLVHPRDGKVVRSLSSRRLLREIAASAWATGDPGVIFLDAVNRDNPTPQLGPLEATNPCGELPLLPHEACHLGSLRLDAFASEGRIDWARLDEAVELAVRFLDDAVEASRYPYPEITRTVHANRKIGLGIMGWADLLVDLGISYDSPEAARLAEDVMQRIRKRAEAASAALAQRRGLFAHWPGSRAQARGLRLRNATVTSIAPTGTLSILAGCSGGIEPYFALAFVRHVLDGERLPETNPRFEAVLRREGAYSEDLIAEVRATGSARAISTLPESIRRLFPIASDITPEWHLEIQAAFQRHVDNAVSKTINLPAHATPEEVGHVYRTAWQRGLKGVTVFREGCKGAAVLVRGADGVLEALEHHAGGCSDARCP
jgi:ribonucleoside-diphosphate reductase alpha chain